MIWAGIAIGALAILAIQGVGLMLIRATENSADDTAEAAMFWYALTGWPIYLIPYLRDRRRRGLSAPIYPDIHE